MKAITITAELIPEDEGGFTVYCPELDIYTQGDTEEECLKNMREAAELHLEEMGDLISCEHNGSGCHHLSWGFLPYNMLENIK